jgi:hypothetical protein
MLIILKPFLKLPDADDTEITPNKPGTAWTNKGVLTQTEMLACKEQFEIKIPISLKTNVMLMYTHLLHGYYVQY